LCQEHLGGEIVATVRLEEITKKYGALQVIHGVTIDIPDGQFVVLVGPSGCGKSTMLRMVAGLETISGGDIRIDGREVTDLLPKERDIAMVFQNYALYPHMSVAENMGFALKLAGTATAEINERVSRAAAILNLTSYLERKPAALSGGQRQRVAMGRAIVRAPKVFLFDEPLSNLDAQLRVQMRSEIRELHDRLGTTTIYVTHDQTEAMTMADQIVVLNAGRVEQVGTPREIYQKPANLFVASFIGSPQMNFISGGIAQEQGAATIGVRPEHLIINQGDGGWPAKITAVEYLGSDLFLHAALIAGGQIIVRAPGSAIHSVGEQISVVPMADCVHRFDSNGVSQ
jgi:multiple sugar transport system ATP-binding protein